MATHAVLLRGINVGGKNRVPMAGLRACLEGLGYAGVATYIASGNRCAWRSPGRRPRSAGPVTGR